MRLSPCRCEGGHSPLGTPAVLTGGRDAGIQEGSRWGGAPAGSSTLGTGALECPQEQSGSTFSWPRVGGGVAGPLKLSGMGGHWGCTGVSVDTWRLCSFSSVCGPLTPRHGDGVHRLKREKESANCSLGLREGAGWKSPTMTQERPSGLAWFGQMRGLQSHPSPAAPNLLR